MNILKKIFSVKEKGKLYTSIKELPISKWWQVNNEGKFNELIIEGSFSDAELYNCYLNLLQEYYNCFGLSEQYLAFIDAKLKYTELLADYIINQKESESMFLEMAKIEMMDLAPEKIKENDKIELFQYITNIEKNFGFQINENELTTYKFYAYQKSLNNG
jgi:hypothetical protein